MELMWEAPVALVQVGEQMQDKKRCFIVAAFFKVLHFFKLLNHNDELSLTNIAFWIFLYKIAIADIAQMSANELATALSVVGLYFGTKVLNRGIENKTTSGTSQVSDLINTVKSKLTGSGNADQRDKDEDGEC